MRRNRVIAAALTLLLAAPLVAFGAQFTTSFPPQTQFLLSTSTTSSTDGVNHQLLGINLRNLDLFFVFLNATGAPAFSSYSYPWLYGQLVNVQNIPGGTRVTWRIYVSTGGANAVFYDVGTIFIDI